MSDSDPPAIGCGLLICFVWVICLAFTIAAVVQAIHWIIQP